METPKIFESEYRFCLILWEREPIGSGELVKLCRERLGWKPTTTYTVIKRLSERGVLKMRTRSFHRLCRRMRCRRPRSTNWLINGSAALCPRLSLRSPGTAACRRGRSTRCSG